MKKIIFLSLITVIFIFSASLRQVSAQMTGGGWQKNQNPPSQNDIQEEQTMQNVGLKIYQDLQNKKITCQALTSNDYERLGEYFMGQAAGSTENHVYWDQRVQQMMEDSGDTQMHTVWGQRGSGCLSNAPLPSNTPSFLMGMMNDYSYGGGGNNMMWGYGGNFTNFGAFGFFWIITWAVLFIDLVLLGIWLWKQTKKK